MRLPKIIPNERINAANIKGNIKASGAISDPTMYKLGQAGAKAGAGAFLGGQFGGGTGAAIGAGAGIASDILGTKLQEYYALQKASKLGGAASKLSSNLPGILGAGGAILGGMAASDASTPEDRRLNPALSAASTAADIALPLPGVDVTGGVQQGQEDALKASRQYNPQDQELAQNVAMSGDLGSDPSATMSMANPVVSAAHSGFIKGALAPVPQLAQAGADVLNNAGFERSNDARAIMEKRMKAVDESPNKTIAGSKALNQATPDQLIELSNGFKGIKGADSFVAPLENAAQASSPEEMQARLFGLYQQPAFRQLLKKGIKSEE